VVELGPGTGPITSALIARGVAPERLVLVEANPRFCALLEARYPTARVIGGDALPEQPQSSVFPSRR
jgi:phosphatidylethanolamine/phosphatidyl-N-methylethanolamine N-methyltransferase